MLKAKAETEATLALTYLRSCDETETSGKARDVMWRKTEFGK